MADIDWGRIAGPLAQAGGTILGGVIGGPAGAVLGPVIGQAVGQALGVDPTPDAIGGALSAPDAAEKVRQIEVGMGGGFKDAEIAHLEGVANARAQQLELVRQDSKIAWSAPIISLVVIVGFLCAVAAVLTRSVQESQIAILLIGSLATKFSDVVSFWIGSSKGSADKMDAIKEALKSVGPSGLR